MKVSHQEMKAKERIKVKEGMKVKSHQDEVNMNIHQVMNQIVQQNIVVKAKNRQDEAILHPEAVA